MTINNFDKKLHLLSLKKNIMSII